MTKCLYCHEVKDADAFNREHVIPEAFGTFEENLVLKLVVCQTCNTYFANHLELRLARDSIEGLTRYDHVPPRGPVSLSDGEFLAGLPPDRAPLAHAVGISWNQGRVVGQVTLFFRFHYRIVLADGGFLLASTWIGKGHLFNPVAHQIIELTPDPRRGRPIQVPPQGAEG